MIAMREVICVRSLIHSADTRTTAQRTYYNHNIAIGRKSLRLSLAPTIFYWKEIVLAPHAGVVATCQHFSRSHLPNGK